ncbi:MAG: hypothetical protein ABIG20_02435 [archaeon]
MDLQKIFYMIAILLFIIAIIYFAWEVILNLSREVKTIILACLVVIFFFGARYFKERGL